MAKKQAAINGMEDEFKLPDNVAKAVDAYAKTQLAKGKAAAKFNTAKENFIATMKEAGLTKIRYDAGGGMKVYELAQDDKIRQKKPTEPKEEE